MSGFVALVEANGRPVDGHVLEHLTAAMAYRGPDRQATWAPQDRSVGLGHAAFHTLQDPPEADQPLGLDDRLWIVADARLDDRDTLAGRLAGSSNLASAPDALLLLHAYDVWGSAMLDRLLGDFAFAIWDAPNRTLFCARDHVGVKPFYYAAAGTAFVAGNTIESLRAHPQVSDTLDDHAIADYLLFGHNRHPERTSFADVRRLPAAHSLTWRASTGPVIERYWRLHVTDQIRLGREEEYVERFDELFAAAVEDRVRGARAAVFMSGGLDSTAVAAVARDVMARRYGHFELAACTFSYDGLIEDTEADHATEVARWLDISILRVRLDDDLAEDPWGETASWSAEPSNQPALGRVVRQVAGALSEARVGFTGQGGDPALHITPVDATQRAAADGWVRMAAAMARHRLIHGQWPRIGLRTQMRRRLRGHRFETPDVFPPWIATDLVERLDLHRRHRAFARMQLDRTATRPEAECQLAGPEWSFILEWDDAGMTGFPAEFRHPFLDVRLIEFCLALPPIPWLAEKHILRRAMKDRLPGATLSRRKAPLRGYPPHELLKARSREPLGLACDESRLAEFLDIDCFKMIARRPERLRAWEYGLVTRPLGLALWLSRLGTGRRPGTEISDGSRRYNATEETVPQA